MSSVWTQTAKSGAYYGVFIPQSNSFLIKSSKSKISETIIQTKNERSLIYMILGYSNYEINVTENKLDMHGIYDELCKPNEIYCIKDKLNESVNHIDNSNQNSGDYEPMDNNHECPDNDEVDREID
ncbi:hypothetical protein RF11_16146 [Thelohanellus kitauei]|uniref:Uncharacterized protein n=1 Tax=Thelohanellus kitauei TaxID=669202 RepID=A0A0C2IYM0_THEKT|nr:hypothetical protein RF11_16146 [Thelohanellus kitauei]